MVCNRGQEYTICRPGQLTDGALGAARVRLGQMNGSFMKVGAPPLRKKLERGGIRATTNALGNCKKAGEGGGGGETPMPMPMHSVLDWGIPRHGVAGSSLANPSLNDAAYLYRARFAGRAPSL